MQVSVITPVYNAASFVTKSVESALQQPETAEVILVEDGSLDNSLEVCQQLAAKYDRVRLFRHPNGENRGAGASRNLAMKNASCEYIAFVDADNYFLPGRFTKAKEMFDEDPTCEGVYEGIGMHIVDEVGLRRWLNAGRKVTQLDTMKKRVAPEELAEALIDGLYSFFCLDGFTIKKTVLAKSGYMNEKLRLHQDTDFMIRTACVARLYPGRLDEPVAMRCVHDHNRLSAPRSEAQNYKNRMLVWMELYTWCKQRHFDELQQKIMNHMILETISKKRFGKISNKIIPRQVLRLNQLFLWLAKCPQMILEPQLWMSIRNVKNL